MQSTAKQVNKTAADVQTVLNQNAGLHIKGVEATVDEELITGITKKLSYSDDISRVSYLLRDPMITTAMHGVDQTIQKNVELHANAGLNPIIKRISINGCCEWCNKLDGTYLYEDVFERGADIYRRHNYCRCVVLYNPMDGRGWNNTHRHSEWGKTERDIIEQAEIRRRIRQEQIGVAYNQTYRLKGKEVGGTRINEVAHHVAVRMVDRDVAIEDIEDAILNPLYCNPEKLDYNERGEPSFEVVGQFATIEVNPLAGKITTCLKTGHRKLARRRRK